MAKIKGAIRTGLIPISLKDVDWSTKIIVDDKNGACIPAVHVTDVTSRQLDAVKTMAFNKHNKDLDEIDEYELLFGYPQAKSEWDPIRGADVVGIISQPSDQPIGFTFIAGRAGIVSVTLLAYDDKYLYIEITGQRNGQTDKQAFKAYRSTAGIITTRKPILKVGDKTPT